MAEAARSTSGRAARSREYHLASWFASTIVLCCLSRISNLKRASSGQRPPATSAIANSGRQLSADRLTSVPVCGSCPARAWRLSSHHRAILRASCFRCCARSLRNCWTFSAGFRRRSAIETERSSNVSGSRPIIAIAAGAYAENCLGSWSSPTVRTICPPRRCPAFNMPRSSSLSFRKSIGFINQ